MTDPCLQHSKALHIHINISYDGLVAPRYMYDRRLPSVILDIVESDPSFC